MSNDTEGDVKFEERKKKQKTICCFRNNKNLVNFDQNTQKSQQFAL